MTSPGEMLNALLKALAAVVGALTTGDAEVVDAPRAEGDHWLVTLRATGSLTGTCALAFDTAGVTALGALGAADGESATTSEAEAALRDLVQQAIGSLCGRDGVGPLKLVIDQITPGASVPSGEAGLVCAITASALSAPLSICVWEALVSATPTPPAPLAPEPRVPDSRLDVILDIELPVVIRFGRTELPIGALTRLAPGSMLDLGRSPDDPVELLVSGRVIARGEVVIVEGNYGIRVLDVVSASERVPSLDAEA